LGQAGEGEHSGLSHAPDVVVALDPAFSSPLILSFAYALLSGRAGLGMSSPSQPSTCADAEQVAQVGDRRASLLLDGMDLRGDGHRTDEPFAVEPRACRHRHDRVIDSTARVAGSAVMGLPPASRISAA
jgi:hypothetical protein